MEGLLIVDKPDGMTSHDVVNRVRRILKTKRVGHTGTLDPFATGVMVILVGQATRLAQFLDKDEKEYEAVIQFGAETDTGDKTGTRTAESNLEGDELEARVAAIEWEEVLSKFRGEIMQVPPMYSAKKVDGKKLYELARQGLEIERKAVSVTINTLEVLDTSRSAVRVRVACSAGTYIRTLAEDIGRAIGLGAHLTGLRRTRAGRFGIEEAITLDDLAEMPEPGQALLPMAEAVSHLPKMVLNEERAAKTRNGLSSDKSDLKIDAQFVQMIDQTGRLIAIGQFRLDEKSVQPKVVFG